MLGLLLLMVAACAPAVPAGEAQSTAVPVIAQSEDAANPTAASAPPTAAAARTAVPTPVRSTLPDLGPALAWDNTQWINSEALTLAELRGKVVLLEFWTFG